MRMIYGSMKEAPSNREGWSFGLTLRFGFEEIKFNRFGFFPSQVSIGTTEAVLVFELDDATMPDDDWAFETPTQAKMRVEVERTTESAVDRVNERSRGKSRDTNVSVEAAASPKLAFGAVLKNATSGKRSDKSAVRQLNLERFSYNKHLIASFGGPDNPGWRVKALLDKDVLEGPVIKTNYFARVESTGDKPCVALLAEIPRHAIKIRDESGAFQHINKRIIGLRRIQKAICDEPIALEKKQLEVLLDTSSDEVK